VLGGTFGLYWLGFMLLLQVLCLCFWLPYRKLFGSEAEYSKANESVKPASFVLKTGSWADVEDVPEVSIRIIRNEKIEMSDIHSRFGLHLIHFFIGEYPMSAVRRPTGKFDCVVAPDDGRTVEEILASRNGFAARIFGYQLTKDDDDIELGRLAGIMLRGQEATDEDEAERACLASTRLSCDKDIETFLVIRSDNRELAANISSGFWE
jgi:hypothetical protein